MYFRGRGGGLQNRQVDLEPKSAALPRRALKVKRSAHHRGEAAADGQTQARPLCVVVGAPNLFERSEDIAVLLGRDTGAGVLDLEAKPRGTPRGVTHVHAERDATPPGELDGIAQQVEENLSEPSLIAAHHVGEARAGVEGEH